MPVAPMFRVPASDDELSVFAFLNIDHHRQVTSYLSAHKSANVVSYDIYPFPPMEGLDVWLANHQSWHTQINSVLGTQSNNLLSVDFKDYNALSAWIFQHASEHREWQRLTGVA